MPDVEAALAPVVHRDNDHQLHDLLPFFSVVPEVLHARRVTHAVDRAKWQFIDRAGRTRTITLRPVAPGTSTHWRAVPVPSWPVRHLTGERPRLWFSDIEQPAAVYVRVAEIADLPGLSFVAFADQLQAHLAVTERRRLIIDLRGNPGGDNSLNPSLVRALIRTPLGR